MDRTQEPTARLRQEADLSREEAARLLEAHGGSLLDTLLDLQRQGRAPRDRGGTYSTRPGQSTPPPNIPQTVPSEPEQGEAGYAKRFREGVRAILRILDPRTGNQVEIWRKGRLLTAVPLLILVIGVAAAFRIVAPLLILGLLLGCRYRCAGPDLERKAVNDVLGAVADAIEDLKKGKKRS